MDPNGIKLYVINSTDESLCRIKSLRFYFKNNTEIFCNESIYETNSAADLTAKFTSFITRVEDESNNVVEVLFESK